MAGTTTITSRAPLHNEQGKIGEKITIDWTSDASGDVNGTSLDFNGLLFRVVTVPSASAAPTANYDISLTSPESSSLDVLEGAIADRHTSSAEVVNFCGIGSLTKGSPVYLNGSYGIKVANAGNAKSGTIYFYLVR